VREIFVARVGESVRSRPVGELTLEGLVEPIATHGVLGLDAE
jgi:hypothetical protein